jgi:hypothetical protein
MGAKSEGAFGARRGFPNSLKQSHTVRDFPLLRCHPFSMLWLLNSSRFLCTTLSTDDDLA